MEFIAFIQEASDVLHSGIVQKIALGSLAYLGLLWLALIIWVARDAIERSNSIIFQTLMIGLNMVLPVFGLLVYLIIRPSKTLMEKYYEELEYKVLEDNEDHEKCVHCNESVRSEYIYCPTCQERMKHTCSHCKKNYKSDFQICPFCGRKQRAIKERKPQSPKKLAKEAEKAMSSAKHE